MGSPLRNPSIMVSLALAAQKAGAAGIRAEGAEDISQIVRAVQIPVIGIRKKHYDGGEVYITPTRFEVDEIAGAGATILALDATTRPRPGGETLECVVSHAKALGLIVMADLSRAEDAGPAVEAGADVLVTTLVAASEQDIRPGGPNLSVIERLAQSFPDRQIIAEGRFAGPKDVQGALRAGASTVVVGKAVTDAYALTIDLVAAANSLAASRPVG
ncbi:indole-3-glycerol phosphate synthase [Leifsonia xyli subsp. cynodontis DSM 46306]|uniref:N-acylglucosamine-6-phosphate 2-epimerase n=1 Tax=Leifsonia xyli subsp. cynodontis DSM 46306 TaxID=1389489 RepID=U3PB03_LEIXC|nr:indole-3-glycerol phosphate synthase [Leifsonia xyli subsp. cynodontis DSM 46306]